MPDTARNRRTACQANRTLRIRKSIGAASEAAKDWLLGGYQQPREHLVQGIALLFKGALLMAKTSAPSPGGQATPGAIPSACRDVTTKPAARRRSRTLDHG